MLFKILDRIRSKPKHIREQYALGIAIFCTMAIGGVWSLSLPARFAGESQMAAVASSTSAAPFSNFFTQLKQQFTSVKKGINELKVASSTIPLTAASSTEAALEMQISRENIEQIKDKQTTATNTNSQFGAETHATTTVALKPQPILIGTTSQTVATGTAR